MASALEQAHVVVKEMAAVPGEDENDTIHLLLKVPRRLPTARLTALIAEVAEVQSVTLD